MLYLVFVLLYRHGDLLYIKENDSAGVASVTARSTRTAVEDEIDSYLRKKDGKIYRERHPQLLVKYYMQHNDC